MRRTSRMAVGATALGLLATTAVSASTAASAAPSTRATLTGSVPGWATAASFKGAATGSDHVAFRVYLGWRNASAAEELARAVSTPGSASYGHYVTPQQFRQQFAPTQAQVTAVQQWLRQSGFTVDYTPGNNHYVAAEGTVAQAESAFATRLGTYAYRGKRLLAPGAALSVPASLPAVAGVIGLDGSAELVHTDHVVADAPPSPVFLNAGPFSQYWGDTRVSDVPRPNGTALPTTPDYPYAPQGYLPAQLRGAYGVQNAVSSGNDGRGVTVAVIDAYASPTIEHDANEYARRHGEPTFKAGQFSQVVAPGTYRRPQNSRQDPQGWYGEETLDVEAVHAMAPGANIVYVGSPNNYQDMDAALNHVVDKKLATIVTNSYGWAGEALPFGFIKPQYDTMVQAAAEGIGVYFSSGDDGDETGGSGNPAQATPDWPASSPWVTAVGGTALAVNAGNTYGFERGWETGRSTLQSGPSWSAPTYQYGSGGGTSRLFAQPGYQKGVVPDAIATASGARAQAMRTVPDVSALGDPNTGFRVGQTQTFPDGHAEYAEYRIGGTSLSSPLFAGVMALAEQRAGRAIGFANPLLYAAAGSGAYHDVKAVRNQLTDRDGAVVRSDFVNGIDGADGYSYTRRLLGWDQPLTIHVRDGYDDVTGVGSPTGSAFLAALAK